MAGRSTRESWSRISMRSMKMRAIRVAKRVIAGKPTLAALGPVGKLEKLELFGERLRT